MNKPMTQRQASNILDRARKRKIIVLGDVILDQFIWGGVSRISPEAPVPVVEFHKESYMPGGAANVARNLAALEIPNMFASVVGADAAGRQVKTLLAKQGVDCSGLLSMRRRVTSVKMRIVAQHQQIVRLDREANRTLSSGEMNQLLGRIEPEMSSASAVICGDYGKGVMTQPFIDALKDLARRHEVWLSLDPKPVHPLNLEGLSLMTPNRKEAFELAGLRDSVRHADPMKDVPLRDAIHSLQEKLHTRVLLITLGEQGMMVCENGADPHHIPTRAQEVFDVSGAGDTVIAVFTLAVASGAAPLDAAILANHAAGIVVGKLGTATVTRRELLDSFQ